MFRAQAKSLSVTLVTVNRVLPEGDYVGYVTHPLVFMI